MRCLVLLRRLWLKYETKALSLIPPLLLIYIFFQPFNHFAGIRNTAFVLMLVLFLIKTVRGGIDINWKDGTIIMTQAYSYLEILLKLQKMLLTDKRNFF